MEDKCREQKYHVQSLSAALLAGFGSSRYGPISEIDNSACKSLIVLT
jgi:hypothetical protein